MARLHMPTTKRSSNLGLLSLAQFLLFLLLAWVCDASLTVTTTVTGEVEFDQQFYVEWTGGDASTYKVLVQEQESTGDGAAVTVASSATSPYSYSFNTGVWKEGHFVFIVESDDEQADSNILTVTTATTSTEVSSSQTTPATTALSTQSSSSSSSQTTPATTASSTQSSSSSSSQVQTTASSSSSLFTSTSSDPASTTERSKATASSGSTADAASASSSGVSTTGSTPSSGLSTGAAIGIGVGVGIAGLLLIGALLLYAYRRGVQAAAARKDGLREKELVPELPYGGSGSDGIWQGATGQNSYLATAVHNDRGGHIGAGYNQPVELSKDINRPYAQLHHDSTQFAELGHNDTTYYTELAAARENS